MPTDLIKKRIESIDLLKGIVMIVMALDHIRDYFHYQAYLFNPVDPTKSNLPVYFTRYITHYCAPTFCLLAGMSAFLSGRRKSKRELSIFLVKRGIWLVILELTLVNFAWQFDPFMRMNGLEVISSLGFSMIALAALIHLPRPALLAFSLLVIFGHNLLDAIHYPGSMSWALVHQQDTFVFSNGFKFYIDYPLLPWIAVMPLGYWFGSFYNAGIDPARRRKIFTAIGFSAIALFFVLKGLNVYGDLVPWSMQATAKATFMSFMNITKYPPSLMYLLITLGPVFIFLGNTENLRGRVVNFFTTYGRVPFFYYLLHLFVVHLLAVIFALGAGYGWKMLVLRDWVLEIPEMKGYGFSLGVVYGAWALMIAITYPFVKWYDRYKAAHKDNWWLSYL